MTDVFLTHLHFDHCGGSVKWNKDKSNFEMVFKNANYYNKDHWLWANNPNAREKASFLKENIIPIEKSGQLSFFNEKKIFMINFQFLLMDIQKGKMIQKLNIEIKLLFLWLTYFQVPDIFTSLCNGL